MRAPGCGRRAGARSSARAGRASPDLLVDLPAGELQVDVLEGRPGHDQALELAVLGQGLGRELIQDARRRIGLEHHLAAVLAVADLGRREGGRELGGRAGRDDLTFAQDGDAVAEAVGLVEVLPEANQLDHLVDRARLRVVAGEEAQVLRDAQRLVHGRGLEHDADPVAPGTACPRRVDAEHLDLPRIALAVALEDLDGGGLAGAVRAEQAEDLAHLYLEVDPAHRFQRAVRLAQSSDRDSAHQSSISSMPAGGNAGSGPPASSAAILPQSGWWPITTTVSPCSATAALTLSAVAPGARRSSGSGSTPTSRANSAPVSRARSSGLVRIASGRTPSAARRSPSVRAARRPSAVSGLSSSGSPSTASAWRTR